jgi:Zn-dependent protease with chaperone function
MWIALALNGVLLAALIVVAGWLLTVEDGWSIVALFLGLALAAAFAAPKDRRRRRRQEAEKDDHIRRQVARICLVADMPEPEIELVLDDAPLSWTTALPRRTPRVHVTTGMLEDRIRRLERLEARLQA